MKFRLKPLLVSSFLYFIIFTSCLTPLLQQNPYVAENIRNDTETTHNGQSEVFDRNPILPESLSPIKSSEIWDPELIDGVYVEKTAGITNISEPIPLELNSSALTTGLAVHVLDINETREYIENGNFVSSVQDWNLNTYKTDSSDVKLHWNTSIQGSPGVANINLTGIEDEHHFTRYLPNNEIDYLSSVGAWKFDAPADPDYDAEFNEFGNLVGSFGLLELSWNWDPVLTLPNSGLRTGYAFANFTYNGTDNLKDAILSFSYNILFGGEWGDYNYGNASLSVYIVNPHGIEYQVGNWKRTYTPSTYGYSETGVSSKTFTLNDFGDIIKEFGNYTLKFRADHSHQKEFGDLRMGSCIRIDGIRFALNYTKKEYQNNSEVKIEQLHYFNRTPRNSSLFNTKFLIITPHKQFNDSYSSIFIKINNYLVYSTFINETQPNEWYTISKFINNTVLSQEFINISIGIHFCSESPITFYPNQTFSLFLDNTTFFIKSAPLPSQLQLYTNFNNINVNKTVQDLDYGMGRALFDNGSLTIIGENEPYPSSPYAKLANYTLMFMGNSSNVSIQYEIVKYGFTWRDMIIRELTNMKTELNSMLEEIRDSLTALNFPLSLMLDSNFIDLINFSRINDFDEAERYASLLGNQFPIMFKGLLQSLNGDFYNNTYNPDHNIDYFTSNTPIELATMGGMTQLSQLFDIIYDSYDWGLYIEGIQDRLTAIYDQYVDIVDSRLDFWREQLQNIQLNPSQLQLLNLSAIYRNLREIVGSLDSVRYGLDTHVNIDPLNSIKNWMNPAQINPVLLDKSFNGIYLGNIMDISELLTKLYNITNSESWRYSSFIEYIQSDSSGTDFSDDFISILNPFGLYGYLPCGNLSIEPFTLPYISDGFSTELNENHYSHTISLGSITNIINYLMLLVLIEDSVIRPNFPLVLDYAYQSTKAILDKTINSLEDLEEFNTLKQEISLNITNSNTVISSDSGFTDIQLKNLGNASSVSLIQKFYLITNNGLTAVTRQSVLLSEELEQGQTIVRRIPMQSIDGILIKSLYGTIYGMKNISNQYLLCQEFYLGTRLAAERWTPIFYSPIFTNLNSSVMDPLERITSANVFDSKKIGLIPDNPTKIYNISDVFMDKGIEYSQVQDNFITLISLVDRNQVGLGEISYGFQIGARNLGYNNTNTIEVNDFDSIYRIRLGNKGIDIISFRVKDVLKESGVIEMDENPTRDHFDDYFCMNISAITSNFAIDIEILMLSTKIMTFLPMWFDSLNLKYTITDYDNKLQFQIPFFELSGSNYFRITKSSLSVSNQYFYSNYYIFFSQLKQIQGTYYNSYLTVYTKPSDPNKIQSVNMYTVIKLFDNTEISIVTEITVEYYGIYRFQAELSPNLVFVLVFGLIFVLTNLIIIRIFKRYAIGMKPKRKRLDFPNSI